MAGEDDEEGEERAKPWRVLVLEDTRERLSADARAPGAGAGETVPLVGFGDAS